MSEGYVVHKAVKVRPLAELQLIFLRKEAQYGIGGGGNISGPDNELGAVASGQDDDLFDPFGTDQLQQGLAAAGWTDPETLADGDRRSAEVQSDYG